MSKLTQKQYDLARGVGWYLGLMESVRQLDFTITQLQETRARLLAQIYRPLSPKEAKQRGFEK